MKITHTEKSTLQKLNSIYLYYASTFENPDDCKKDVSICVANGVSACSPKDWTWRYFVSLKNGSYHPSRWAIEAISIKYAEIKKKPPKPKPLPHDIAKRTLVIHATEYELHEIQERLSPRERTVRLKEKGDE